MPRGGAAEAAPGNLLAEVAQAHLRNGDGVPQGNTQVHVRPEDERVCCPGQRTAYPRTIQHHIRACELAEQLLLLEEELDELVLLLAIHHGNRVLARGEYLSFSREELVRRHSGMLDQHETVVHGAQREALVLLSRADDLACASLELTPAPVMHNERHLSLRFPIRKFQGDNRCSSPEPRLSPQNFSHQRTTRPPHDGKDYGSRGESRKQQESSGQKTNARAAPPADANASLSVATRNRDF